LKSALKKAWAFAKKVIIAAKDTVVKFVRGVYHHAEATVILILSSLGLNSLLGELPFWIALPMWVEATMVVPVISVLIIVVLTKSAEWRATRRATKLQLVAA